MFRSLEISLYSVLKLSPIKTSPPRRIAEDTLLSSLKRLEEKKKPVTIAIYNAKG